MGFVTESQMRTDYTHMFTKEVGETEYNIVLWKTPEGILLEIVHETMDSQSVNEEVVFRKIISEIECIQDRRGVVLDRRKSSQKETYTDRRKNNRKGE